MCRYECYNPLMWTLIETNFMGEADFWASLGYTVVENRHKIQLD